MPFISDKLKIGNKKLDRRVKLTDDQRKQIIKLYKIGGTFRGLARVFFVDRKTIKNIVFPDFYKKQLKKHKEEKHWQKYYNREKHNEAVKKHRCYKYSLFKQGLLERKGGD